MAGGIYTGLTQPSAFSFDLKPKKIKYAALNSSICTLRLLFLESNVCGISLPSTISAYTKEGFDLVTNLPDPNTNIVPIDRDKYYCLNVINSSLPRTIESPSSASDEKYEEGESPAKYTLEGEFIDYENYMEFRKLGDGSHCVAVVAETKGCCMVYSQVNADGTVSPLIGSIKIGWDGLPYGGTKTVPFIIDWTSKVKPSVTRSVFCDDDCYVN